jgi:glycine/D-amino acid oxidase-like deaminating enzyme
MTADFDLVVLGGGIIGCAVAWGAVAAGARVAVVDGGDETFRASVGNFGLLWTQGKGANAPAYAKLTRDSARLWPDFARELVAETGVDFDFRQEGGTQFILDEALAERQRANLAKPGEAKDEFDLEFIPGDVLREMLPMVGPTVPGATYCRRDGVVNPLLLLKALRRGLLMKGATFFQGTIAEDLRREGGGCTVVMRDREIRADRVLLSAGLENRPLGEKAGIDVALFPQRGQLLVTERTAPFLPVLNSSIRQTAEGTVLIGATQEDAGFDKSVDVGSLRMLAERAIRIYPHIGRLRLVRSWACLRIMTPDGLPIYAQSPTMPGVFVATAHSGITLGAIHAREFAPALLEGVIPEAFSTFRPDRFGEWKTHTAGASH